MSHILFRTCFTQQKFVCNLSHRSCYLDSTFRVQFVQHITTSTAVASPINVLTRVFTSPLHSNIDHPSSNPQKDFKQHISVSISTNSQVAPLRGPLLALPSPRFSTFSQPFSGLVDAVSASAHASRSVSAARPVLIRTTQPRHRVLSVSREAFSRKIDITFVATGETPRQSSVSGDGNGSGVGGGSRPGPLCRSVATYALEPTSLRSKRS